MTTIPIPNKAEKNTAEKLDIPNMLYAKAMNQKGRGGFAKSGMPARVTTQKFPEA